MGKFTDEAIRIGFLIGMNIKRSADDGIQQNYGEEEGEIASEDVANEGEPLQGFEGNILRKLYANPSPFLKNIFN